MQNKGKVLSSIQKLMGDAYSGSCQKKYRHKKDVLFMNSGTGEQWLYKFDYKLDNELEEFRQIAKNLGADKCYITWTAIEGYCNKEVQL